MLKAILFNDTSHNRHHGCQIVVKQIYALAAAAAPTTFVESKT